MGNVTDQEGGQVIVAGPECVSEICSENCALCRASCQLHRLKVGVRDLVDLLEADYVSECEVCVDTAVQTETVEMRTLLNSIGDELIPNTPHYCVSLYYILYNNYTKLLELLTLRLTWYSMFGTHNLHTFHSCRWFCCSCLSVASHCSSWRD